MRNKDLAEGPEGGRVGGGALEGLERLAHDLLAVEPAHVHPRVVHLV